VPCARKKPLPLLLQRRSKPKALYLKIPPWWDFLFLTVTDICKRYE